MIRRAVVLFWLLIGGAHALEISLPTPNDALLRPGGDAAFYQPTVEGTVESGMFGCVRRGGSRFHEGVDIQALQRDRRGESVDPVIAIGAGRVAFINSKPGLSNYGRYLVLMHRWDGVTVFSLYAHLRDITAGLAVGQEVRRGQRIGTVGRSTNTREGISPDRAHLHLEIGFMLNPHFQTWYARREPKAPPFGNFNGKNFVGLDPAHLLRAASADPKLNFAEYVAQLPVAFTVLVAADRLPWAQLHPEQIIGRPAAVYEVSFTTWGVPVKMWPRAKPSGPLPALKSVNEAVLAGTSCQELVERHGQSWRLNSRGIEFLEMLTFVP